MVVAIGTLAGREVGASSRSRPALRVELHGLMKAAVYYETGGPEVFSYEDMPCYVSV